MEVDKRKKFSSANVIIKGFMEKVIFELGLERVYIRQKWRRKQTETGYTEEEGPEAVRTSCDAMKVLVCWNCQQTEKLKAGRIVIFYWKQQSLFCGMWLRDSLQSTLNFLGTPMSVFSLFVYISLYNLKQTLLDIQAFIITKINANFCIDNQFFIKSFNNKVWHW